MRTKASDIKIKSLVLISLVVLFVFSPGKQAQGKTIDTAVGILTAGLSDTDPAIRSIAIEAAASSRCTELMPKIQELMTDNYVVVRFSAIVAISDLDYMPAAKLAKKLLTVKEENTKLAAAYAMVKLGNPDYLDNIRKGVESQDETLQANAAFLLGKAGDKTSLELLYSIMNNSKFSDKVRLAATEALATLGDDKIFPRLWAKALSKFSDDRIIAIEAMGALATSQAKDVLLTKLDDEDVWVRIAAAGQLAKMGNYTGKSEIMDVVSGKYNADMDKQSLERLNMQTCNAIGQMCSQDVTGYLPGFMTSESKFVRIAAAKATLQCYNKTKIK
jgi:HEAT repeat protein